MYHKEVEITHAYIWDHFGLHQEKIVRLTMELEVPKMLVLRNTLSNVMVQWVCVVIEAIDVLSLQKSGDRCREMLF